jgi:hypothetical protein
VAAVDLVHLDRGSTRSGHRRDDGEVFTPAQWGGDGPSESSSCQVPFICSNDTACTKLPSRSPRGGQGTCAIWRFGSGTSIRLTSSAISRRSSDGLRSCDRMRSQGHCVRTPIKP